RERIRFAVHVGAFRFNGAGITELQRTERHVDRVACHVAQGAGAKINPSPPDEGMISVLLERPRWSRSEPEIPIKIRRNRIGTRGPRASLRPDRAIRPNVHFTRVTNDSRLDYFHRPPQSIRRAS